MVSCEECLNRIGNSNLQLLKLVLSQWLEEQQLDPDGNIDLLQGRICERCQGAET